MDMRDGSMGGIGFTEKHTAKRKRSLGALSICVLQSTDFMPEPCSLYKPVESDCSSDIVCVSMPGKQNFSASVVTLSCFTRNSSILT